MRGSASKLPVRALGFVLMALFPVDSVGQQAGISDSTLSVVDAFVERHRGRFGWPGVAISISTPTEVVFARGYGGRTVQGTPITEDTPFYIGSVTKTMTAFAIAKLGEEGHVDLDAPIGRYLPSFSLGSPYEPGTLSARHLLHHRSGLSQWDGHDRTAQEEGRFDHLRPTGPPAGEAEYSSLNYMILGRVIEEVSDQGYGDFLAGALFEPLGMTNTWAEGAVPRSSVRAQGHRNLFGFNRAADEPAVAPFLVPAGFVAASANDMGRYTGMLLGRGVFAGVRVLDSLTVEQLFTPMEGGGPAMAWGRARIRGALTLGHSGNARTSSARVRLIPDRGYAITVLVNSNTGPLFEASNTLLDGIHAIMEGEPAPVSFPAERLFKGVVLAATLLSIGGLAHRARSWGRAGYPVALNGRSRWGRLTVDVAGAGFLAFGLPRLIGVPLPTLVEYFPDLGVGIAISAGAGFIGGFLRAFTASQPPTKAIAG